MKKFIIIALVVIMLLAAATSILVPFNETVKKPDGIYKPVDLDLLTEVGAKTYYTGKYSIENVDIVIDGSLDDEAWISVSPEKLRVYSMNNFIDYTSNLGWQGRVDLYEQHDETHDIRYSSDVRFFVAQDEEFVYIAIKDIMPHVDLDQDGTFNNENEGVLRHNYYFRFGFNPQDYSQQLVFRSRNYSPEYMGIADAVEYSDYNYGVLLEAKAVAYNEDGTYLSEDNVSNHNSDGTWYNIIEFKLDKDAIRESYKAMFNVELSDADLTTYWLGLSGHTYRGGDAEKILCPLWGTYLPDAITVYGLPSRYIPTRIVFGEK